MLTALFITLFENTQRLNSIEHTIEVIKKAHYYTNDFKGNNPKYIWIVAHGYGQTGERIIRKFDGFDESEHLIISPEGLSLFYWGGVSGSYAASWMTSKNRLDEIDDFCNYLDKVLETYNTYIQHSKLILLGFSQGATTLYRWIHARKHTFDFFVNWAGWFPEDIDMGCIDHLFEGRHMIVYGNEDQYLMPERVEQMRKNLEKENFFPEIENFKGKHEIKREVLQSIFLNKLL